MRCSKLLRLDYYLNLIGVATKPIQNTIFEELGIKLKADTNRIYATVNGKHAVASGLNPGDEIIAIDNIKVSRNNFEQRINNCPIDSQVNLQIFRDKVLITVSLTIPNPQYERLEFMYTANSQNIIQQKWLT
jgi:predicted metalloprotease with PDZ domain